VSLCHQPEHRRYCLHLTYGPPLVRGRCVVIEDLPTLSDISIHLNVPQKIKRVRQPVRGKTLKSTAGRFVLPVLSGHELVVIDY
jgi:hypothetical protein